MLILTTDGRALEFHGAHITITTKHGTPYYCVNVIEYNGSRAANNAIVYSATSEEAAKQLIADLCTAAGEGLPVFLLAEWESNQAKEV